MGLLVLTWRESQAIPVQAMEEYAGGATDTRSLNLHTRRKTASRPDRFTPGRRPAGTQRTGDWVGRRAGVEVTGRKELKPSRKYKYSSLVQPVA